MKRVCGWALALSSLVFSVTVTLAGDWPHLRGPNLDGRVIATGPLQGEDVGLDLDWTAPLGPGYSGIAVADGRAVTLYSDGESALASTARRHPQGTRRVGRRAAQLAGDQRRHGLLAGTDGRALGAAAR
jgi:hypothetical protein